MIRVGVVRGGTNEEYEISLDSGEAVLRSLRNKPEQYLPVDILVTKDGTWHISGTPADIAKVFHNVDLCINCLKGESGENGSIQKKFEEAGILYTGSPAFSSVSTLNKSIAKDHFKNLGLKTPRHIVISAYQSDFDGDPEEYINKTVRTIHEKLSPPWIFKPLSGGSGIGIQVAKTIPDLARAVLNNLDADGSTIVEELLSGREVTNAVIEDFRGEKNYTFPVQDKEVEEISKKVFSGLGLRHSASFDFIVTKNGIYILEANSIPALNEGAKFRELLKSVGSSLDEYVEHLINKALSKQ